MPEIWSAWKDLLTSMPNEINNTSHSYTANFNNSSNLESSFDVEIKYPISSGMKTVNTVEPVAYLIEATGGGTASIHIKLHSVPITVSISFPK